MVVVVIIIIIIIIMMMIIMMIIMMITASGAYGCTTFAWTKAVIYYIYEYYIIL
jgi:hypothetical protein